MKHVIGFASKIVFYVFLVLVGFWTCSLTVSFVGRVLPGGQVEPYLALAVFDGGALTWLLVFLGHAKGLGQRAIALLMLVMDLLGVGVMCIAELFLGGQNFTTAPENLGMIAVWVIGIWTFVNLAAGYAIHVLSPSAHEEITKGVALDRVRESGLRQLEAKLEVLGAELADEMGSDLLQEALRDLGLRQRGPRQLPSGQGEVIDAPVMVSPAVGLHSIRPKMRRSQRLPMMRVMNMQSLQRAQLSEDPTIKLPVVSKNENALTGK